MNYDESTVERFCSANNFCGMPMWLKYQNYLFSAVEEKLKALFPMGEILSLLDLLRQEYVKGRVVDKYRIGNGNIGLI